MSRLTRSLSHDHPYMQKKKTQCCLPSWCSEVGIKRRVGCWVIQLTVLPHQPVLPVGLPTAPYFISTWMPPGISGSSIPKHVMVISSKWSSSCALSRNHCYPSGSQSREPGLLSLTSSLYYHPHQQAHTLDTSPKIY